MNKTLFKLNKNKSIESWNIQVIDNSIVTTWGKLEGKQQTRTDIIEAGKNIGKANETTPQQQAILEAISTIKHKLDKGYAETIEEATDKKEVLKPVLVHDYTLKNNSKKINFPCYIQPKLDGIRCQITLDDNGNVVTTSRGNKSFPINSLLFAEIKQVLINNGLKALDGEFYFHGEFLEDIISCVKKPEENRLENLIEFHIFDLPLNRGFDKFSSINLSGTTRVKLVETTIAQSYQEAKECLVKYIGEGFEGIILRNTNTYEEEYPTGGVRSYDIQKWKEFSDSEFEIIDVVSDKNDNGVFVCKNESGAVFNVTPKASHEYKKQILKDKANLIGKMLTVRYQELTALGIPKFATGSAVRDYE